MRTNAKWRLVVLALSTLLPVSVWTQSFTGSISGTIKDPSGAVIPNVEVTLKSLATGVEAKFATGSDGLYHFQGLPQGTYELKASAQGFRNFLQTGITVATNQAVTLDVALRSAWSCKPSRYRATPLLLTSRTRRSNRPYPRGLWEIFPFKWRATRVLRQLSLFCCPA